MPPGPPASVSPPPAAGGYSGTPLPRKLGIREGTTVRLVGAPRDFATTLGPLPDRASLRRRGEGPRDVTIWFVRRRRVMEDGIVAMAEQVASDKLWMVWAKKSSALSTDVSERDIRAAGLAYGLVDFKICAVDHDWSGLCFARRK